MLYINIIFEDVFLQLFYSLLMYPNIISLDSQKATSEAVFDIFVHGI